MTTGKQSLCAVCEREIMTTAAAVASSVEVGLEPSDKRKMKKKKSILINLTHCRYDSGNDLQQ
jgi:hypothetical protein